MYPHFRAPTTVLKYRSGRTPIRHKAGCVSPLTRTLVTMVALLLLSLQPCAVVGWNHHPDRNNHKPPPPTTPLFHPSSLFLPPSLPPLPPPLSSFLGNRRHWMTKTLLATTTFLSSSSAHAACLQGDLNPNCIGVYKVPLDDRILPFISTPQALKQFAPDLEWVAPIPPPTNPTMAWELLETQRLAATDIYQVVQQGRLEEAGIKILNLLPIVTQSSKLILDEALYTLEKKQQQQQQQQQQQTSSSIGATSADEAESSSDSTVSSSTTAALTTLASNRLETSCALALGLWGETDIMVGQGLKGDLGVSAVAQIQILNQLKEAMGATDDFMSAAASITGRKLESTKLFE